MIFKDPMYAVINDNVVEYDCILDIDENTEKIDKYNKVFDFLGLGQPEGSSQIYRIYKYKLHPLRNHPIIYPPSDFTENTHLETAMLPDGTIDYVALCKNP